MPSPLAAGWEQLASNYRTSILEFLALSFTERSGVGGGGKGEGEEEMSPALGCAGAMKLFKLFHLNISAGI